MTLRGITWGWIIFFGMMQMLLAFVYVMVLLTKFSKEN